VTRYANEVNGGLWLINATVSHIIITPMPAALTTGQKDEADKRMDGKDRCFATFS